MNVGRNSFEIGVKFKYMIIVALEKIRFWRKITIHLNFAHASNEKTFVNESRFETNFDIFLHVNNFGRIIIGDAVYFIL